MNLRIPTFLCVLCVLCGESSLYAQKHLVLDLNQTIALANDSSLESFRAQNMYLSGYWEYRTYRANRLPSLTLDLTPAQYNRDITKRYDSGSNLDVYRTQQSYYAYGGLSVKQNLDLTGGAFYLESNLAYMRNFGDNSATQLTSVPVRIGYSQSLVGYNPDFQQISPQPIRFGRFFNEIDMEQQRKVCILTEQVWLDLFPGGEDPVGSTIRMNNMYLTVIGMIKVPDRGFRFHGDKSVLMPVSTMQQMYNMGHKLHSVAVAANDDADIKEVETNIKQLVFARHTISPDDTKAVYSQNLGEQVNKFNSLFGGIGTLTWIVGIGTLLAGLVGVSNIMLVIVRERTQEIGVRRALGARPRIIISQIMSESFVLTFVAGIFGLALAVALLSGAESVLTASAGRPIRPQISFGTGMLSMTVLILGSLLAGILPASRALRIKPVDAIREE